MEEEKAHGILYIKLFLHTDFSTYFNCSCFVLGLFITHMSENEAVTALVFQVIYFWYEMSVVSSSYFCNLC